MTEYVKELNHFITSPLRDDIDPIVFLQTLHNKKSQSKIGNEFINQNLKDLLFSHDISMGFVESFCKQPSSYMSQPHIDVKPGDFTKIIWQYGGRDSTMNWLSLKPNCSMTLRSTIINTPFYSAGINDVVIEHTHQITKPVLVQVGCLHSITNPYEERFAITFSLHPFNNRRRLTFAESVDRLSTFIS